MTSRWTYQWRAAESAGMANTNSTWARAALTTFLRRAYTQLAVAAEKEAQELQESAKAYRMALGALK